MFPFQLPFVPPYAKRLGKKSASTSSTIEFSWAEDFEFVWVDAFNVFPATNQVQFQLRTSSDGGTTFDSGASDYDYRTACLTAAYSSAGALGTTFAGLTLVAGAGSMGNVAGETGTFRVTLFRPLDTSLETDMTVSGIYASDAGGNINAVAGAMRRNAAARVNGVQFLMSSGNIATGEFIAYGVTTQT